MDGQIFGLTVDCGLLYEPWSYPVFRARTWIKLVVQAQALKEALRSLACVSVVNDNWMLAHARLKYFLLRSRVSGMRVSRTRIPPPARIDHVIRDELWGNYFREPRNNALREGFKITDGITFFDAFEERPKFLPRLIAPCPAPSQGQLTYAK